MLKKLQQLISEFNKIIQQGRGQYGTATYIGESVWNHFLGQKYALISFREWLEEKYRVYSFGRITIIIRR
jgi:hypothetical protein